MNSTQQLGFLHPVAACALSLLLCAGAAAQERALGEQLEIVALNELANLADALGADIEHVCRRETFDAAVLATDLPEKTVAAAAALRDIPLRIWCPGQYAQHFSAEQVAPLVAWADLIILNRFEWRTLYPLVKRGVIERFTTRGKPRKPGVIVTRGAGSVVIWSPGATRTSVAVPPVTRSAQRDPTGCGDALSAGVIAGLVERLPVTLAVERGIAVAQLCLQQPGTQHHLKDLRDSRHV